MAKKNLHTKRGLSSTTNNSSSSSTHISTSLNSASGPNSLNNGNNTNGSNTSSNNNNCLSGNSGSNMPINVDPPSAFSFPRELSNLHSAGLAPVRPLNLNIAGSRAFDPFNDGSLNSAPIQGSLLGIPLTSGQITTICLMSQCRP